MQELKKLFKVTWITANVGNERHEQVPEDPSWPCIAAKELYIGEGYASASSPEAPDLEQQGAKGHASSGHLSLSQ